MPVRDNHHSPATRALAMSSVAMPLPRHALVPPALLAVAAAFALAVGLAVGDPGSGLLLPVAIVLGLAFVTTVVVRPFVGFMVLVFSLFFLVVVRIPDTARGVNPFDLTLFPVLFVSWFGAAHRRAVAEDVLLVGGSHDAIRSATRRFTNGALLYFGIAAFSLVPMVLRVGPHAALISGLALFRGLQGASIYLLASWWLRDERHTRWALRAALTAAIAFVVVNCVSVFGFGAPRAGIVWWVNETREVVGSPNEAAVGLLMLWVLLSAMRAVRPRRRQVVFLALLALMVPLTQSRSGLLAFATYLLLTVRHVRWRWVVGSLALFLVVVWLVPSTYWDRLTRSVTLKPGSFELFTFLARIYGYQTAWRVFLDHPIFGVGYVGFRFVSNQYNNLRLVIGQAENGILEALVGLGLVGFVALIAAVRRLFTVGRIVREQTSPGTLGHELARRHAALLVALLVANLTGVTFIGMVGVGQLALWTALLVRAGHLAVPGEGRG
jgi:hypothetical protein